MSKRISRIRKRVIKAAADFIKSEGEGVIYVSPETASMIKKDGAVELLSAQGLTVTTKVMTPEDVEDTVVICHPPPAIGYPDNVEDLCQTCGCTITHRPGYPPGTIYSCIRCLSPKIDEAVRDAVEEEIRNDIATLMTLFGVRSGKGMFN
jgi:hypothetical protein